MAYSEAYAQEQLRRARHPLRRIVKHFYVARVLANVVGPTIDLGCGAGQLLERLPTGSVGLESNPVLVENAKARGLDVRLWELIAGQGLGSLEVGRYRTLVLSHVLEHFDDAARVLNELLADAHRLGVERVVLVVPGRKGFESDSTHRTFIDAEWMRRAITPASPYSLETLSYFPANVPWLGPWFTYHELHVCLTSRTGTAHAPAK